MEDILIHKALGVRTITFNRPTVKNAIDNAMFEFLTNLLNKDAVDDDITITVITGKGDYFSSGVDIKRQLEQIIEDDGVRSQNSLKNFITALINYPKLLIALVNGPAVGIAVTMLGLCDIVYATDTATFQTPFTSLGLCPEGCSSYLFPRMFGRSVASEILFLGRKLTAKEALDMGFISKIIPHKDLEKFQRTLVAYGKLPQKTTINNKRLITWNLKSILHQTNEEECNALGDCYFSEECSNSMMEFLSKKPKSKL